LPPIAWPSFELVDGEKASTKRDEILGDGDRSWEEVMLMDGGSGAMLRETRRADKKEGEEIQARGGADGRPVGRDGGGERDCLFN
jgi:hypothetical protein